MVISSPQSSYLSYQLDVARACIAVLCNNCQQSSLKHVQHIHKELEKACLNNLFISGDVLRETMLKKEYSPLKAKKGSFKLVFQQTNGYYFKVKKPSEFVIEKIRSILDADTMEFNGLSKEQCIADFYYFARLNECKTTIGEDQNHKWVRRKRVLKLVNCFFHITLLLSLLLLFCVNLNFLRSMVCYGAGLLSPAFIVLVKRYQFNLGPYFYKGDICEAAPRISKGLLEIAGSSLFQHLKVTTLNRCFVIANDFDSKEIPRISLRDTNCKQLDEYKQSHQMKISNFYNKHRTNRLSRLDIENDNYVPGVGQGKSDFEGTLVGVISGFITNKGNSKQK